MRMNIRQNEDKTLTLELSPNNRKEFNQLNGIWKKDNTFEKKGYCIHADAKTQHGIENSDFTILISPTKNEKSKKTKPYENMRSDDSYNGSIEDAADRARSRAVGFDYHRH